MSTKSSEEQLDEIRDRIDALQAMVQQAGTRARDGIKDELEGLQRQETSARSALRPTHHQSTSEREHAYPAKDEYLEIETKLGALESEMAAEIARGPGAAS